MMIGAVVARRFERRDQSAVKSLILAGLGEHFGEIRYDLNPDLDDIEASYLLDANADFFVVEANSEIVGSAGLLFEEPGEARMVRLSTKRDLRRQGVARKLLEVVEAECKSRSISVLWAYTQPEWTDAVSFYGSGGFTVGGRDQVDLHFRLEL